MLLSGKYKSKGALYFIMPIKSEIHILSHLAIPQGLGEIESGANSWDLITLLKLREHRPSLIQIKSCHLHWIHGQYYITLNYFVELQKI